MTVDDRSLSSEDLRQMAETLEAMADVLSLEVQVETNGYLDFAARNLREAAGIANRRLGMVQHAGSHMRVAISQTVMLELTRASFIAQAVMDGTPDRSMPELEGALSRARELVVAAVAQHPGLISYGLAEPTEPDGEATGPSADLPEGWFAIDGGYASTTVHQVLLRASKMAMPDGNDGWAAQFGVVGISIHPTPGAAAQAAILACDRLMSGRPATSMPELAGRTAVMNV